MSKYSTSREIFAESTTRNGSLIETGMTASMGTLIAVTVSGAVALILLVTIMLLYLKKRICHVDGKTQPVSIKRLFTLKTRNIKYTLHN